MLPRFVLLLALFCVACDGHAHDRSALSWMQDLHEVGHAMAVQSPEHGPELYGRFPKGSSASRRS